MSRLCTLALENGIEVEHVRRVIRASTLEAPDAACWNWPWPVRIFGFGPLRIEIDGKPLSFARKAPRRLLDLIGMLVASPGEPLPEPYLIDALWTDCDGDAAHNDLSVAVHRLRKLLGAEAVVVDNGVVTLNPRRVWTDVRAFQSLLDAMDGTRANGTEPVPAAIEQAITLYRGRFLAGDDRNTWTLAARWQFHEQFLGAVIAAGARHERAGRWLDALGLYTRALAIDRQSERLYQALFRCHAALGMGAEAAAAWKQCQTALGELGQVPSERTAALYRAVGSSSPPPK
jgi:LuxR family transcriptional regulator, maltose regulon positive regulatory protein